MQVSTSTNAVQERRSYTTRWDVTSCSLTVVMSLYPQMGEGFLGEELMNKTQAIAIGIYFALLILCTVLLIVSNSLSITVRDAIIPLASDGFKLVIGALIGAVSAVIGVRATTAG